MEGPFCTWQSLRDRSGHGAGEEVIGGFGQGDGVAPGETDGLEQEEGHDADDDKSAGPVEQGCHPRPVGLGPDGLDRFFFLLVLGHEAGGFAHDAAGGEEDDGRDEELGENFSGQMPGGEHETVKDHGAEAKEGQVLSDFSVHVSTFVVTGRTGAAVTAGVLPN